MEYKYSVSRHTYLFTQWSRVLLEKLTGLQLVEKFPAFYGTQKFITALTSARHLSLSWASSIQSTQPHPTSRISILILSSHLRLGLPSGLLPSGFPTKTLYKPLPSPYALHALPISFFLISLPAQYWVMGTYSFHDIQFEITLEYHTNIHGVYDSTIKTAALKRPEQ